MEDKNVYQAINSVMGKVGYVQKEKTGGLIYSFAGEAALIAAIRPHMVEHGLVMYVKSIEDIAHDTYTTAKGSVMNSTTLRATISFVHAPSQTSIDVVALGEGADSGDKSSNKALTGAFKYALRQTFVIETGDDPDREPSEHQERAEKKVETKQDQKPAPDSMPSEGAWVLWDDLAGLAEDYKLKIPVVEKGKTNYGQLRAAYAELKKRVNLYEAASDLGGTG